MQFLRKKIRGWWQKSNGKDIRCKERWLSRLHQLDAIQEDCSGFITYSAYPQDAPEPLGFITLSSYQLDGQLIQSSFLIISWQQLCNEHSRSVIAFCQIFDNRHGINPSLIFIIDLFSSREIGYSKCMLGDYFFHFHLSLSQTTIHISMLYFVI